MAARWIAGGMLVLTLMIVGIFLWAVIRPPAAPEALPGAPVAAEKQVSGRDGAWILTAEVVPQPDRTIAIAVSARQTGGEPRLATPPPVAVLRMLDMEMEEERVALVRAAAAVWRGSARLSMAGRWALVVEVDGARLSLPFQAVSL